MAGEGSLNSTSSHMLACLVDMSPMPNNIAVVSAQAVQDVLQEAASLLRVHFGIPDL